MKTPDKIYLGIEELDSGYVYALSLENNGHDEYIRKDTLLEWAKDYKARTGWYEIEVVMDELIDKLNSM